MATDNELPTGQIKPSSTWGEFNNIAFLIQQSINKMQTATLVRIESCTNSGGLSPVGFVDVTPLVNQLDAAGNPTPHVTIFNVPYFRLQGGKNAIIIDPEPGDIGLAVFASRDITKVKSTKSTANPGSFRRYDFGDALYIGGMLNGTPEQYVQFSPAGIRMHSPVRIKLDAPDILMEADTVEIEATASVTIEAPMVGINCENFNATSGGTITFTTPTLMVTGTVIGTIDCIGGGISLKNHTHGGVTTGPDNTGAPN